jgi:hypothetical protein
MSNIFTEVVTGLKWLGNKIVTVSEWLPKVVKLANDVDGDAETVLPDLTTVVEDVDSLAVAAVKDGGAVLTATATLVAQVEAEATTASSGNFLAAIENSPALLKAAEAWWSAVIAHGSYSDVIAAEQKLVADYDKLGATAKAAIAQLEADAS